MDGQLVWCPNGGPAEVGAAVRGDAVVFSGIVGSHTFAWAADEAA